MHVDVCVHVVKSVLPTSREKVFVFENMLLTADTRNWLPIRVGLIHQGIYVHPIMYII